MSPYARFSYDVISSKLQNVPERYGTPLCPEHEVTDVWEQKLSLGQQIQKDSTDIWKSDNLWGPKVYQSSGIIYPLNIKKKKSAVVKYNSLTVGVEWWENYLMASLPDDEAQVLGKIQ